MVPAMNTLPTELVSLLGSSIFGSLIRLIGFSVTARHRERLIKLYTSQKMAQSIDCARKHPSVGLQLTRRVIALMAVFSIIILPKLASLLYPDIPIFIGYNQSTDGFLFFSGHTKLIWAQMHGLIITPLDTHLLSAIIGLYFGSALVDFKA